MSEHRGPGGPNKSKYRRDGWSGSRFRRLRESRERSKSWVAARTGRSERAIERYEADEVFPPHGWRDQAALALGIDRADLGAESAR